MELQEAKDYVLQLMKDKDKIESDLKALKEILDIVCMLFQTCTKSLFNYIIQNKYIYLIVE